jgi:hypothetical protein
MVVEMWLKSKLKIWSFLINCYLYLNSFGRSVVGAF